MDRTFRLWRTVRWLRPSQLYGRAWAMVYRPVADLSPAPPTRHIGARWRNCARRPSLAAEGGFVFLNQPHAITKARDWNHPDWPALWLYNAHYFDDLVAEDAAARSHLHIPLIARWIADNPPGGGVGWDPYPTSLRIVNWVKWAWSGNRLSEEAAHSLAAQARWLRKRLEWHLLGNHLWANAKAMVFAGAYFEGPEAQAWLEKGLALVDHELGEQVLADGGHYERSPMYHAIVLEDLLDLVQLAAAIPGLVGAGRVDRWTALAARMQAWLWTMTHPDGGIAFFNDAALGIAPDAAALGAHAGTLGLVVPKPSGGRVQALAESGYVRLQVGPAVVVADVGDVGPDHQPGHAHADTLSFELSLGRRRVLVNGGTSLYAPGPERLRQRGTAAHSTVQVDHLDSSEVWSSFRVGRRARSREVAWEERADCAVLRAAHDGYCWRPGRPLHHREFLLNPGSLKVGDRLSGPVASAVARFHLHPDWTAHVDEGGRGWLQREGERIAWSTSGRCTATVERTTWHPEFGLSLPAQTLVLRMHDGRLETFFSWE